MDWLESEKKLLAEVKDLIETLKTLDLPEKDRMRYTAALFSKKELYQYVRSCAPAQDRKLAVERFGQELKEAIKTVKDELNLNKTTETLDDAFDVIQKELEQHNEFSEDVVDLEIAHEDGRIAVAKKLPRAEALRVIRSLAEKYDYVSAEVSSEAGKLFQIEKRSVSRPFLEKLASALNVSVEKEGETNEGTTQKESKSDPETSLKTISIGIDFAFGEDGTVEISLDNGGDVCDDCPDRDDCDMRTINEDEDDEDDESVSSCDDCPTYDSCGLRMAFMDEDDDDEDEDEDEDEELDEISNHLDGRLSEYMNQMDSTALIAPDVYYYHEDETGLFEKFKVTERRAIIELISTKDGALAEPNVLQAFLCDETDYYQDSEELLLFNDDEAVIERVMIVEPLEIPSCYAEEIYLVVNREKELRIAMKYEDYAGDYFFRYAFDYHGAFSVWFSDCIDQKDRFIADAVNATITALSLDVTPDQFSWIDAAGRPMRELADRFPTVVTQPKEEQPKEVKPKEEQLKEDGSMSLKNKDDIQAAGAGIGDGKRYNILDAPRYNQFIAYVDPKEERGIEGGLAIHFAKVVEESRYDDYEIKVVPVLRTGMPFVIMDHQVVRELTDYLQMTADEDFLAELMNWIDSRSPRIIPSGVRHPLILIPDIAQNRMVVAFKQEGKMTTQVFNAACDQVAGGKRGMSCYIDLDILGGYINGRSK